MTGKKSNEMDHKMDGLRKWILTGSKRAEWKVERRRWARKDMTSSWQAAVGSRDPFESMFQMLRTNVKIGL
jgi:hypothetical protein